VVRRLPWGNDRKKPGSADVGVKSIRGVAWTSYHPQSKQGGAFSIARYEPEVLVGREFKNLLDCQKQSDPWRQISTTSGLMRRWIARTW